jgi:serine/threonine protein kinase
VEATQDKGGTLLSREDFLTHLRESGLSGSEDMIRHVHSFMPEPPDGPAVAELLIRAGHLTPYQAEAVCDRKFDTLVIGNYEVVDRLGAGGMGTVYKARHRRMKRVVALKILPRSSGQPDSFLPRFQREVVVISQLSHPNIVMAFDADESPAGHYLVMEFVNGKDLASLVRDRGPLPVREAVDVIVQAARALEYAHSQGIIHRDIKPANLLHDQTGVVKVADLGLARVNAMLAKDDQTANSGLTQAGGVLGTVDYMSPEQAFDSTAIDHRADIYSLACTLYFLLTAQPPYRGSNAMATLFKHSAAPIPSLSAARTDIPQPLEAVFQKAMAKAPAERYQSMTELIRALEAFKIEGPGVAAPVRLEGEARPCGTVVVPPGTNTMAGGPSAEAAMTLDLGSNTQQTLTNTILLVEPSRTQANIIRKYLQELNYPNVLVASTAQKALEQMRSTRVYAVVGAVHLDDMSGAELLTKIRQELKQPDVGFVAISSSQADSAELTAFRGAPRTALLTKPFDRDKLRLALSAATAPTAAPTIAGNPRFASLRVLLVDDSKAARAHYRGVLAILGFRHIAEAGDGTEAIAQLTQAPFDLVVTDYNMPLMDGRALVGYIRLHSANPKVPVVMVTSETDPVKLQAVRSMGVSEFCDKSFKPEILRGLLDRLFAP